MLFHDFLLCYCQDVEILKDPDAVKQLGNILKTNVRACKALNHPYVTQVIASRISVLSMVIVCLLFEVPLYQYLFANTD